MFMWAFETYVGRGKKLFKNVALLTNLQHFEFPLRQQF